LIETYEFAAKNQGDIFGRSTKSMNRIFLAKIMNLPSNHFRKLLCPIFERTCRVRSFRAGTLTHELIQGQLGYIHRWRSLVFTSANYFNLPSTSTNQKI